MIKYTINKLPLSLKWSLYFVLLEILNVVFSWMLLIHPLSTTHDLGSILSSLSLNFIIQSAKSGYWPYFLAVSGLMAVGCMIGYLDNVQFVCNVNKAIKDAINERNLGSGVDHLVQGKSHDQVHTNLQNFLLLLKSFDLMKASRILLDMNTIKSIMNNISTGILLVNAEKVVTHINHNAERMLKLIPGEIIGQVVSRKISNDVFLDQLNNALDDAHKITDVTVTIKEIGTIRLNIIPLKNKFGDIARGVIFLDYIQKEAKDTDPPKKA